MTPESLAILAQLMTEVTTDLFAGYGVTLVYAGPADPTALPKAATVAGFIGFGGVDVRGTLLLASTEALFAAATPERARGAGLVREWAAELTNQLLGRLKNQLYRYGVDFNVSTPTALSGDGLAVATPASRKACAFSFLENEVQVWICLDVVEDGLDLTKLRDDGGEAAREGDLVLF